MKAVKVIAYCRVSTERQRDNYSVERQREDALKFANAHGDPEPKTFEDVWSGRDVSREGWQALIARIRGGGVSAIWGAAFDRLARNTIEGLMFAQVLLEYNVELWVAGTRYDLTDHNVMLTVTLQLAIAQSESSKIRDRTMIGRERSANAGNRKVPNVLGYSPTFVDGKKSYIIYKEEADLVRYIFHLFDTESLSFRALAHRLNDEGYTTKLSGKARVVRKGKARGAIRRISGKWQQTTVSKVLRNPEYIGTTYDWAGETLVASMHFSPILDRELWERVQRKIAKLSPERNRNGIRASQHQLSGIPHCAQCGAAYYYRGPQGRNKHTYYFHKADSTAHKQCQNMPKYVRADILHAAVESLYIQIFTDESQVEAMMRRLKPKGDDQLAKELSRIEKALKAFEERRSTIQEGFVFHLFTAAEAATKLKVFEGERQTAELRRQRILLQMKSLHQELEEALYEFTQEAIKEYMSADGEGKRNIYRRVIRSLTLLDGTVRTEWIIGRVDSFETRGVVEHLHGLGYETTLAAEHHITPSMSQRAEEDELPQSLESFLQSLGPKSLGQVKAGSN